MRRKTVITGDAVLAAETAARLLDRGAGEVFLFGDDGTAASDITAASPRGGEVLPVASWDEAAGADVVVIAGGDVTAAASGVAERCPGAVVVVSADPVEEACAAVLAAGRFPRGRVLGVGPEVEALRLRAGVARALGLAVDAVAALVLGGRGARAVPVLRAIQAGGMAITDKLPAEQVAALIAGVHTGAPAGVRTVAAATAAVADAVARDTRAVAACTVLCQGELGVEGALTGVPVVVGAEGVERVLDAALDDDERAALAAAAVPYAG
jgi:malate dehydrogenase